MNTNQFLLQRQSKRLRRNRKNVCLTTAIMMSCLLLSIAEYGRSYAFQMPSSYSSSSPYIRTSTSTDTICYNFFKKALDDAFANDRNLSTDKSKGQYDAPGEEFEDPNPNVGTLTETQKKWRGSQLLRKDGIAEQVVAGTSWRLDLFLAGVPDKDPSNDLYGSKINISSRDRQTGLALPDTPSATLTIEFLEDGQCKTSESSFTSGLENGEWKLSEDGKILRFSMDTLGYTRTVETKGSIQKIYWTDEEEKIIETTTTYQIPPGFVYGDIQVTPGRQPGTFTLGDNGILRIEQSSGLFGIASRMIACGKFIAKRNEE